MTNGYRRAANEKLEQLKHAQEEVDEAEREARRLEDEKESKVGIFRLCCLDKAVHLLCQ